MAELRFPRACNRLAAWLAAVALLAASGPAAAAECSRIEHGAATYTVCTVDPRREAVSLHLRDAAGEPYGHFGRLRQALEAGGRDLVLAMNAGMYHADRAPVGLYIEDGRTLSRAVTGPGPGNFHLRPNGVFYVTAAGRAGVMETRAFVKAGLTPRYATQSGPMLVIAGKLHPRFLVDATSRKIRNGVGVTGAGQVVFAISQTRVTFHDFAVLFRDRLAAPDALYLDGTISRLYAPAVGRDDFGVRMGPIVAVTRSRP